MATARDPRKLEGLGLDIVELSDVPSRLSRGALVVHSAPPEGSAGLVELLGDKPSRVVYLSSTGVYGAATVVDEKTPVDDTEQRARARLLAEQEIATGTWSTLVLRPAAIYGPGRGAHERVRRGDFPAGDNVVSRIHVEDLASHVEAGLLSELTGAFPVADEEPCTTREIAEFCSQLLGVPMPKQAPETKRATGNRRVDGSAIRRALGITLRYPSYREGIPAALAAEPSE